MLNSRGGLNWVSGFGSTCQDAWEGLDQNLESSKRLALLDQALRDGDEAAKLCGKAAQKMEEALVFLRVEIALSR